MTSSYLDQLLSSGLLKNIGQLGIASGAIPQQNVLNALGQAGQQQAPSGGTGGSLDDLLGAQIGQKDDSNALALLQFLLARGKEQEVQPNAPTLNPQAQFAAQMTEPAHVQAGSSYAAALGGIIAGQVQDELNRNMIRDTLNQKFGNITQTAPMATKPPEDPRVTALIDSLVGKYAPAPNPQPQSTATKQNQPGPPATPVNVNKQDIGVKTPAFPSFQGAGVQTNANEPSKTPPPRGVKKNQPAADVPTGETAGIGNSIRKLFNPDRYGR